MELYIKFQVYFPRSRFKIEGSNESLIFQSDYYQIIILKIR
jgi:hypothetical protein